MATEHASKCWNRLLVWQGLKPGWSTQSILVWQIHVKFPTLAADRHVKKNTATYVTIPQATETMATQQLGACKFWWMFFPIWQLYVRIVYACCGFNCLWFGPSILGQSLHTSARHVPLIFHFGACRVTQQRAAALMSLQFAQTVKVEVKKGLSTVFEW